jgi:uncharacterized membrane protein (UPF0127 family)
MMRRPAFNPAILALLWTLVLGAVTASASDPKVVEIATRNGVRVFSVEVAADDETRARGLMYRRKLPEEHGMLFDFQREEPVAMWMHNTYISLDMIFIQGDGRILRIAERTEPLSDRIIPSGGPVRAVLEVPGGTAKKFGIAPGDRIGHPIFSGR